MDRIAIVGYGNVGRGVEAAVRGNEDQELVCVFTHRDPASVQACSGVPVIPYKDAADWRDRVDAVIICSGSATELPVITPELSAYFNVVDSFDNHSRIPEHFERVDQALKSAGRTGVISVGWDPGLFSLARLYMAAALPCGSSYTFWGRGVSQGHSDALRRISGVKKAIQYTVPSEKAMASVRNYEAPELTTRQKHTRECYVVTEPGADPEQIRRQIVEMPAYFADYDTTVTFLSEEEFDREHCAMPHGGTVLRTGITGVGNRQKAEFSLELESNPEFTGSVMAAYARAVIRLNREGAAGAMTAADIAPRYLLPLTAEEIRRSLI